MFSARIGKETDKPERIFIPDACIEYDGALYHVTSRGDRQEPIYERAFLTILGDVVEGFG